MEPPVSVLEAVQKIHKHARIGWVGKPKSSPEDLNAGYWALIQLYSQRDSRHTMLEPWNERGPIYGKPFDRLSRIPIYVIDVQKDDIYDLPFLLKRWITPIKDRVTQSEIEKGKGVEKEMSELGEAAGDYLWHLSNKTGASVTSNNPKKCLTEKDKKVLAGETKKDFTNAYVTNVEGKAEKMR
jgi:hypothetical protein